MGVCAASRMEYGTVFDKGTLKTPSTIGKKPQSWAPIVKVEGVIAKKGSIPIAGRYSSTKALEDEFTIEQRVLGAGISGPVRLATCKGDGNNYAVKTFKKENMTPEERQSLKKETEIHLGLCHPHVVRLEMVYETNKELHLVTEYMEGGELLFWLNKRQVYLERAAIQTAYDMLLATAYLHAHNIVHRDLKPENFLYEKKDSYHLKIIDFGFATVWNKYRNMSLVCGSPHYLAPEVYARSYTDKADMWSLGVIIYMLLTGKHLFKAASESSLYKKIKVGAPTYCSAFSKLSKLAQEFVQALLVKDPEKRLSAKVALQHPWITNKMTKPTIINRDILRSLRTFACTPQLRRAMLSMMAWSLSAEDRMELREQFLFMADQKGTISQKALKNILEKHVSVNTAETAVLFNSLDIDSSDEIDYNEFLAAALPSCDVHGVLLRKTFARFDRSGCGMVSAADLAMTLGSTVGGADLKNMIKDVDTSGDGHIDYEEFVAYFHRTGPEAKKPERESCVPSGKQIKNCAEIPLSEMLPTLLHHLHHDNNFKTI